MNEELKKEVSEMIATAVATAVGEATKQMTAEFTKQLKGLEGVGNNDFLDKDLSEEEVGKLSEEDKKAYFMHKSCIDYAKNGTHGKLGGKEL